MGGGCLLRVIETRGRLRNSVQRQVRSRTQVKNSMAGALACVDARVCVSACGHSRPFTRTRRGCIESKGAAHARA
eukprot:2196905-Pleurochrysis_carterae.AAC.1